MSDMFCFQCQQTAGGSGCVRTGVCGKLPRRHIYWIFLSAA